MSPTCGGAVRRRSGHRLLPLLAATAGLLTACAAAQPPERAQAQGLWPTSAERVALVATGDALSVTDGARTEPVDVVLQPGAEVRVVALDDDHLGLLSSGPTGSVHRLSLANGSVEQQACADCQGLAALGERLVSVLPNGSLVSFGADLAPLPPVPLQGVDTPPDLLGEREPDWEPSFTVLGQQSGEVVVGRLAPTGGARGGPSLVSRHDLTGRLLGQVEVEGRAGLGQPDHSGQTLVVESSSSSGYCDSGSYLATADGRSPASGDGDVLQDWSWTGDAVVVVSVHNETTAAGECDVQEGTVHQRALDGRALVSVVSPGLSQLRWLRGCDRPLALRQGPDGVARLLALHGGAVRDLGAARRLVWTAPGSERCDVQAAVSGFGAG